MEQEVGVAGDANMGVKNDIDSEILEQGVKGNVDLSLEESGHSDADELSEEVVDSIRSPLDSDNVGTTKVGDVGLAGILENEGDLDLSNEVVDSIRPVLDSDNVGTTKVGDVGLAGISENEGDFDLSNEVVDLIRPPLDSDKVGTSEVGDVGFAGISENEGDSDLSNEVIDLIHPPLDSDKVGTSEVGDVGFAGISENEGDSNLSNEVVDSIRPPLDSDKVGASEVGDVGFAGILENEGDSNLSNEVVDSIPPPLDSDNVGTTKVGDVGLDEISENKGVSDLSNEVVDLIRPPLDSDNVGTTKVEDVGLAGISENKGDPDLSNEVSEEVIGAIDSVPHTEHTVVNSDLPMGLESRDEKQISTETIVRDENNGTMDDCIVEGNKEDSRNLGDIVAANGEAININGRHEKMDESNQKPTSGTTKNLSYLEVLISSNGKQVDTESRKEQVPEMHAAPEPYKSSRHETDPADRLDNEICDVADVQDVNVKDPDKVPRNGSMAHEEGNIADSDSVKEQTNVIPSKVEGVVVVEGRGDSSQPDACLQPAAELHEPVSQIKQANAKQEIKTAANNSSAGSRSQHPVDLKQSMLLPERGSQNKEHGSRSAANSTSVTSEPPAHPTGLGQAAPLPEPTSLVVQHPRANGSVAETQNQLVEVVNGETEEYDETREKLQMIRVKFLRLARRLGQTPHNVVVAQVLYRLGLAEQLHGRSGGRVAAFSFDRASAVAEQLEAAGQEPLDFTCTIMVIGKSGVGKSSTINSIFDDVKFGTDAFESGTKKVQDVVGTVEGIRVRVIDTPGLLPSWSDQHQNEKILWSVKRFIKKTPPDIILYLDRLDMQSRDFGDMPLLRTITDVFGPSIWFNAIVVLTHAASAPPEGPNGTATSYDLFVTQRSHVVQQAIRQAAGDMRLMNPVSLVENHSACRTNRAGQRVLPNGQIWKPHLLLLSFASKILAQANTLLQLQDTPPGRPFAPRTRSPPLPFLLSSLLQSRPEVKLPSEQFGLDDDSVDDDLDDCLDSDEESEYDQLPSFKSLTKEQLSKLTKEQRKAYYDELEYREKLLMKKQLIEERKRRKIMKKMQEEAKSSLADYGDNVEEETNAAASVPVPMPDIALPASFDSDNPTYRYRSLDSSNPWLFRAVLESNGWDHDVGYDGVNVERLFAVKDKVPVSLTGHISKDKKDTNLQMEIASTVKHGKGKSTSLGFDMQSVGKDYAYTLRSETRFMNFRINKAAAGLSVTHLGDVLTGGIKLEDKLIIGKRGEMVVSGGAIYGRGDVAYGGSLEATLKDKDQPLGRFLSTLGLSVMDWHGDLAIGCNSQTQIPIGRHTNLIGRININNKGSGQASLRINSSEQLQIVLVALIPLVHKVLGFSQQMQHGQ